MLGGGVHAVSGLHQAVEPLLEHAQVPVLVEVHLGERDVAHELPEHRLLLVHGAHLAAVVVLVTPVHLGPDRKFFEGTFP